MVDTLDPPDATGCRPGGPDEAGGGPGGARVHEGHDDWPMFGLKDWVADRFQLMDRSMAVWLDGLAELDRQQLWAEDGQLSCVDWLMWRLRISRGTAFEKLRVARELRRRPVVAEALAAGEISYSAARAITRLDMPGRPVDEALVRLAREGPVVALEQAIRYYQILDNQENLSDYFNKWDRRGMRVEEPFRGGYGAVITILDALELAEVKAAVQAFMKPDPVDDSPAGDNPRADSVDATSNGHRPVDESPAGDSLGPDDPGAPVDESPAEDWEPDLAPYAQRQADAFMAMVRTALAHAHEGHAVGADRYMVHAVVDTKRPAEADDKRIGQLLNGTLLEPDLLSRMVCDSSLVVHMVDGVEPLNLGRKTRSWSTAQRRAITVRDGKQCRFPGCRRRIGDIHHVAHWEHGGATDIANGAYVCTRHHTLLHKGYDAVGDTNGQLTFKRPDGTVVGSTAPPNRAAMLTLV